MPRKHVVITGTGRTGTTFLVQVLAELGFDTGAGSEDPWKRIDKNARAGIENNIRVSNAPYIIKSPAFSVYVHDVLEREDIEIEHIYIPMRDLAAAAESRRYVVREVLEGTSSVRPSQIPGGLVGTDDPKKQEVYLLNVIYHLLFHVSKTQIPVTLLMYPRLVQDYEYLYKKLVPILQDKVHHDDFVNAFQKVVRPDWVHHFTDQDR